MTIVTTVYRYKRPPRRKKAQATEIAVPVVVEAKKPGKRVPKLQRKPEAAQATAIVTAKKTSESFGDAPGMTPEEVLEFGFEHLPQHEHPLRADQQGVRFAR